MVDVTPITQGSLEYSCLQVFTERGSLDVFSFSIYAATYLDKYSPQSILDTLVSKGLLQPRQNEFGKFYDLTEQGRVAYRMAVSA